MWINTNTLEIFYFKDDIRKACNASLPRILSDEVLATLNIVPITQLPKPEYDFKKTVTKGEIVFQDNVWVQGWVVADATQQEIEDRTNSAANSVRQTRDRLLAQSDWTQVADAPVDKAAWAAYRQALRDVPSQEGFPWNVTFPEKP